MTLRSEGSSDTWLMRVTAKDYSDCTGLKEQHTALWSITNDCVDCGGCARSVVTLRSEGSSDTWIMWVTAKDCGDCTGLKEQHTALWSITDDCGDCAGQSLMTVVTVHRSITDDCGDCAQVNY